MLNGREVLNSFVSDGDQLFILWQETNAHIQDIYSHEVFLYVYWVRAVRFSNSNL